MPDPVNTVQYPHGAGGLFTTPGVEPGIVSTMVQPLAGLEGYLEARGHVRTTTSESPIYEVLTGQKASEGTEPTTSCAPGKTAGDLKLGHVSWPLGRMQMCSKVADLSQAGSYINRSEMIPRELLNNPFKDAASLGPNLSPRDLFTNRLAMELFKVQNALGRDYRKLLYTGNPVNTAGSTGYMEYVGLQKMINTGYRDVVNGVFLPSLDSILVDFANANIQATAGTYVNTLVEAYAHVTYMAEQMGLSGTQWAFVGTRGAFRALTEVWPCTYQSYRCAPANTATTNVNIDATSSVKMIEDMRRGQYLLIDGMQVPYIIDDAEPETSVGGGVFGADLFLMPISSPALTDTNGQALFMEYFDFNAPGAAGDIIRQGGLGDIDDLKVSSDGRYLIAYENVKWCINFCMVTRKRMIERLPWLAVRFTNVRYTVRFHERSAFPGDAYWVNGGSIYGAPQTLMYPTPV